MKFLGKGAIATAILAFATQIYAANVTPATNGNISVTPAEKAKIQQVVHEYLVSNPEVLVEALQVLQRKEYEKTEQAIKQTQQSASSFTDALFHQANDPVAGNPNGKITVVEFFDYQCPHCVDMAPTLAAIIQANPDVRVVYKEFPIRGPMSEFASRAALAANKQGKYYQFSHALLATSPPLTQDKIFQVAKDTGLDVAKLKADMSDNSVNAQLKANLKLAQDLKLFGTPALFVGKSDANAVNYFPGQLDQKQLQDAIDKAKS